MPTKNRTKRRGGAATVFPLNYFSDTFKGPSAPAGHDLLKAIPPLGIRAKIGGKRQSQHRKSKKTRKGQKKQTGGFVPSVMGNFIAAASKYIAPAALFAGYKMLTKKQKKQKKQKRQK